MCEVWCDNVGCCAFIIVGEKEKEAGSMYKPRYQRHCFYVCAGTWWQTTFRSFLIHLHLRINLSDKEIASIETNGSSHLKESQGDDECVPKVQQCRHKCLNLKLGEEVEDGIEEHVEGGSTSSKVWSPPPVVVLRNKQTNISTEYKIHTISQHSTHTHTHRTQHTLHHYIVV